MQIAITTLFDAGSIPSGDRWICLHFVWLGVQPVLSQSVVGKELAILKHDILRGYKYSTKGRSLILGLPRALNEELLRLLYSFQILPSFRACPTTFFYNVGRRNHMFYKDLWESYHNSIIFY